MRVVYLTAGSTVHDRRFAAAWAERGHEVLYVRFASDAPLPSEFLPDGAHEVSLGAVAAASDAAALESLVPACAELFAREGVEFVHAGPLPSGAWLAARAGAPRLAAMSWGSDVLLEAELDADVSGRVTEAIGAADLAVCDCEHTAGVLSRRHGADPASTVVFPWGVDLGRYPADERFEHPWADDPKAVVVASFRTHEPVYGVATAVAGFLGAAAEVSSLRLVLGGSGSLTPQLREFVADSGLGSRVHFAGALAHDRVPALLGCSDIYLSASVSDGTSISLLEAMASELPCVVTDIPCNREWVSEGEGGRLAPAGDSAGFAAALAELAPDCSTRACMGARNRMVVQERADWPAEVKKLFAAVDAVIECKGEVS